MSDAVNLAAAKDAVLAVVSLNGLIFYVGPVALIAASYRLSYREYGTWNLALTAVGAISVCVCGLVGHFVVEHSIIFAVLSGVIASSCVALCLGKLLDYACFSAWTQMPPYWGVGLSFGFAALSAEFLARFYALIFGKEHSLQFPEAGALREHLGPYPAPTLIAICFGILLITGAALNKIAPLRFTRCLPLSPQVCASLLLATCAIAMYATGGAAAFNDANQVFSNVAFLGFCGAVIAQGCGPVLTFFVAALLAAAVRSIQIILSMSHERLSGEQIALLINALVPLASFLAVVAAILASRFGQGPKPTSR